MIGAYLNANKSHLEEELQDLERFRPVDRPPLPTLPLSWALYPLAEMMKIHDLANNDRYHDLVVDHDHATMLHDELQRMNNKNGLTERVPDCQDFPVTLAERKALANDLFKAMIDTSEVIETEHIVQKSKAKTTADD